MADLVYVEHTSPMNTLKIHLHVEWFSLKTHWRLAERLLYYQVCKRDPHGIMWEGKRSDQVSTCAPGKGLEKEGNYTDRDPPWEVSSLSPYWAPQPWCPTLGRQIPLADCRTAGTNRRTVGSLDSTGGECTHDCILRNRTERPDWNCTRHLTASHNCPGTRPSLSQAPTLALLHDAATHRSKGCHGWEESSAVRDKAAQTQSGIWAGGGAKPLLSLTQAEH